MNTPAPSALGFARMAGFTVGDFACNLYWQSVSIFLLFFYTDVVGLSAGVAGLIYMIASVVDALCDPVMGAIADRTRTPRGRYRPYVLFGAVPLALAFVLLYLKPPLIGLWLAVWMLTSHIVFRLAYTALSIPYTALNARLTRSSDERSTMAGLRMVFAVAAALAVSYFTAPLVAALGHGHASSGFMRAAAMFALVATAIFPLVYLFTREPPEDDQQVVRIDLAGSWRAVLANRAFWVLVVAACASFACSTALGKSVLYYFKYQIGDEAAARYALSAMSAVGFLAIPGWVLATKLIGKRAAWFVATAWSLSMLALFGVVRISAAVPMILWLMSINAASLGLSMTFWSMLPDTVEFGELRSGERTEAFIFGLGQFFLKAALGLGAGLFGWFLQLAGYRANVVQTAQTLAGLRLIMLGLPAAGLAFAAAVMAFYPMRKGGHEAIVAALATRGAAPEIETLDALH